MNSLGADRKQTIIWTLVGLALLVLFWLLTPILAPFVFGAVFAYICDPAVAWLVRRKIPRPVAVLMVILLTGVVLATLLLILVPMFYKEVGSLIQRLPDLIDRANEHIPALLGEEFRFDSEQIRKMISDNWSAAQSIVPTVLGHIKTSGMALITILANLVLVPFVMFYLLQEWPRIIHGLETAVPRPWISHVRRILKEIDSVLSQYLRGQLLVMLLLAAYYSIGLWIAGLDFALPVGIITGLLVFVPYIGFGTGLILAIMAAVLQGQGWPPLIGVAVVYTIGQLIESFGLTPYLVGERIGLHPLAVIFALLAFGQLFGFVGVLVALPVSAALLVGLREVSKAWFASPVYLGYSTEREKKSRNPKK